MITRRTFDEQADLSDPLAKARWMRSLSLMLDDLVGAANPAFGTTANRPTLTTNETGFSYFDTDLGQPIWWSGTGWVDATGAGI